MQHVLMQHVPNTLHAPYDFGGKHHVGWGLPNVKRGVGLFTHCECMLFINTHTYIVLIFTVYAERWQTQCVAHFVDASCAERGSFMQHAFMQHVPTTLHASCYFGGKHHGWVGASQCEERGGALHEFCIVLFMHALTLLILLILRT